MDDKNKTNSDSKSSFETDNQGLGVDPKKMESIIRGKRYRDDTIGRGNYNMSSQEMQSLPKQWVNPYEMGSKVDPKEWEKVGNRIKDRIRHFEFRKDRYQAEKAKDELKVWEKLGKDLGKK